MDSRNVTGENSLVSSFDFLDLDIFEQSAPEDLYWTKWLGFDRYHCIIYGVSCYYKDNPPSAEFELKKLGVFTRKMSKCKKIKLPSLFYDVLSSDEEYEVYPDTQAAISKNGEYIAVAFKWCRSVPEFNENVITSVKFVLCLISTETGVAKIYHVTNFDELFTEILCECERFAVLLKGDECFLRFTDSRLNHRSKHYYYHVILDNELGEGFLTLFTELRREEHETYQTVFCEEDIFLGDKLVAVSSHNTTVTTINCFETETKLWKKLIINRSVFPDINVPFTKFFSQENNLFASIGKNLSIWKYDESENFWNLIIGANLEKPTDRYVKLVCASPELVLFLEYDENEMFHSIFCYMFNLTNVLTLKDICFLKIWKVYYNRLKMFSDDFVCKKTIFSTLPAALTRRYFGPVYFSE